MGEDHPHTLETKNDFAVFYKEQGRYNDAEPLLIEASGSCHVTDRRAVRHTTYQLKQDDMNRGVAVSSNWRYSRTMVVFIRIMVFSRC